VASINRKDSFHAWSREQLGQTAPPLLTCEAVLAESCFLLRQVPGGSEAILELLRRGVVKVAFRVEDHAAAIMKLMAKYADFHISLADACLVRMSELNPESVVMTLDSDFGVYRRHGRQTIPVLMPQTGHAR
jgi:predicted nucleic acid-binding protein